MYTIRVSDGVDKVIAKWKKSNLTWSRHITAHDRIIYDIYEEVVEVYILEVEGHYNDK